MLLGLLALTVSTGLHFDVPLFIAAKGGADDAEITTGPAFAVVLVLAFAGTCALLLRAKCRNEPAIHDAELGIARHQSRRRPVWACMAIVIACLPLPSLAVSASVVLPQLGRNMAVHWSDFSSADGFADPVAMLSGCAVVSIAATCGAIVLLIRRPVHDRTPRLAATITFLGALSAMVWISSAHATIDASSLDQVELGWHASWILLPVALGAAQWWAAAREAAEREADAVSAPRSTSGTD